MNNPAGKLIITLIILGLLAGCGQPKTPAQQPDIPGKVNYQEYTDNGVTFSVPVPDNWYIASGSERQGTLTIQLGSSEYEHTYIIIVVSPGEMSTANLLKTGEKLLTNSLYQPTPVTKQSKKIGTRSVQVLTASAGENQVVARTAAFSEKGKSYFLTLITREAFFEESVQALELTLDRIK